MSRDEFIEWFLSQAVENENGCWNWPHNASKGYGKVWYHGLFHTHVLSYILFVDKIPTGLLVCHSCDNPACYNPQHLFVGTYYDNTQDMVQKGRSGGQFIRGEHHGNAVLTDSLVHKIMFMDKQNIPRTTIARTIGITKSHVSMILTGYMWNHVTGLPKRQR